MRLCLISMDATSQTDADRLFSLPALSALREKGVSCTNVQTIYPTITYPIHTSIVTGCYPDRHGIGHNQPFQPETPHDMKKWFWEFQHVRAKTLFHAAREKGMDIASVLWPVTGKCGLMRRNFPEVHPLPGENAVLKMLRYATPLWILKTEILYGRQRKSIQEPDLDEYAALLAEKLYASRRPPDMFTLHLVDCDSMRHEHGADSPQAYQAMERLDNHVGRIYRAVEKAGLLSETFFCVVSDHGQQNILESVQLDEKLKACCGARAQSLGMGAYIFADDLKRARQALEEHRAEWKIAHIYDEAELRALHAPASVHLAADAEAGVDFTESRIPHFGDHGFPVTAPEAKILFMLSGPGIPAGTRIEKMNLVDIAPTLADILGLSLPDTDGRSLKNICMGLQD